MKITIGDMILELPGHEDIGFSYPSGKDAAEWESKRIDEFLATAERCYKGLGNFDPKELKVEVTSDMASKAEAFEETFKDYQELAASVVRLTDALRLIATHDGTNQIEYLGAIRTPKDIAQLVLVVERGEMPLPNCPRCSTGQLSFYYKGVHKEVPEDDKLRIACGSCGLKGPVKPTWDEAIAAFVSYKKEEESQDHAQEEG